MPISQPRQSNKTFESTTFLSIYKYYLVNLCLSLPRFKVKSASENGKADGTKIIQVTNITARNLFPITWNAILHPYIKFMIDDWTYQTSVTEYANSLAKWSNLDVRIPCNDASLTIAVFHENLTRDDQEIGRININLDSLKQNPNGQTLDLNLTETKARNVKAVSSFGNISMNLMIKSGTPSKPNETESSKWSKYQSNISTASKSISLSQMRSDQDNNQPSRRSSISMPSSKISDITEDETVHKIKGNHINEPSNRSIKSIADNRDLKLHKTTSSSTISRASSKVIALIDHAFNIAKSQMLTSIRLNDQELLTIFDALGYNIADLQREKDSKQRLEISLTSHYDVARTLNSYLSDILPKSSRIHSSSSIVSRQEADLCLDQLSHLIVGPWRRIRSRILEISSIRSNILDRPINWSQSNLISLLRDMGLKISEDVLSSGEDFVCLDDRTLEHECKVKSSILKKRIQLYQTLLKVLDQWWMQGYRPGDVSSETSKPAYAADAMTTSSDTARRPKSLSTSSKDYPSTSSSAKQGYKVVSSSTPMSAASSLTAGTAKTNSFKIKINPVEESTRSSDVRVTKSSQNIKKLSMWGKISQNPGDMVEIASTKTLIDAWLPFNRAYAWNVSYDDLCRLSECLGGGKGILLGSSLSSEDQEGKDSIDLEDVKGCRWIRLERVSQTHTKPESDIYKLLESLSNIYSSIIRKISEDSQKELASSNRSSNAANSKEYVPYAVLVPLLCLCEHVAKDFQLSSDDLYVGNIVRIVEVSRLSRLYESYDKWDRPSIEMIRDMAGMRAEIISISDVMSKGRVGIRTIQSNIFDAIPIDGIVKYIKKKIKKKGKEKAASIPVNSKGSSSVNTVVRLDKKAFETTESASNRSNGESKLVSRLRSDTQSYQQDDVNVSICDSDESYEVDHDHVIEDESQSKGQASLSNYRSSRSRRQSDAIENADHPDASSERVDPKPNIRSISSILNRNFRNQYVSDPADIDEGNTSLNQSSVDSISPSARSMDDVNSTKTAERRVGANTFESNYRNHIDYSWLNPEKKKRQIISSSERAYEDVESTHKPEDIIRSKSPIQVHIRNSKVNAINGQTLITSPDQRSNPRASPSIDDQRKSNARSNIDTRLRNSAKKEYTRGRDQLNTKISIQDTPEKWLANIPISLNPQNTKGKVTIKGKYQIRDVLNERKPLDIGNGLGIVAPSISSDVNTASRRPKSASVSSKRQNSVQRPIPRRSSEASTIPSQKTVNLEDNADKVSKVSILSRHTRDGDGAETTSFKDHSERKTLDREMRRTAKEASMKEAVLERELRRLQRELR